MTRASGVDMFQVDSFTSEPFRGNPAGVCLLEEEASESWMQAVAAEMNLPETAFAVHCGDNDYSIRWFTPKVEVPLCGHATLASAHVLWEQGHVPRGEVITLQGKRGVLSARRESDWICLDFPALPLEECMCPSGLSDALRSPPVGVYQNSFPAYLAELDSADTVLGLQPDFDRLGQVGCGVCIVTARSESSSSDFVSRFFAPKIGIDEDPVTGGAHCSLGPYWAERLGKSELVGHQLSKRGGVVKVRARGDRVDLLGQAVTVLHGKMFGSSSGSRGNP